MTAVAGAGRAASLTGVARPVSLQRRLVPLQIAAFLQGIGFWVPIEKLFMTEIGFTPASIGVMAAAYAAFTPLVEIPSGILADRWSRRGVLIVSGAALTLTALIGGLSNNVATYIVSALILGVFFAMNSGTLDSVVYDTLLEQTGDSGAFEQHIGRVRMINSIALVASALAGGWLAEMVGNRATYFITAPCVALSVVALLVFDEPRLHKASEPVTLGRHIALTYQAIARRGQLLPIVVLSVLAGLVMSQILEFGPLWLVALAAPAVLFGPYWAGLMSTFGLGGLLAGRLRLDSPRLVGALCALTAAFAVPFVWELNAAAVIAAHLLLLLLIVVASIHITRLLHDAVPSSIRSGVASGVGALSWLVFLPIALLFGLISNRYGVHAAGWLIVVAAALTVGLLLQQALQRRRAEAQPPDEAPSPGEPGAGMDCNQFVELVSAFLGGRLDPGIHRRFVDHLLTCEGCERYLDQFRLTIDTLGHLPAEAVTDDARAALDAVFDDSSLPRRTPGDA